MVEPMRILIYAPIPLETGNRYIRDGSLPQRIQKIMSEIKPEAAYFLERNGRRTAIMVASAGDSSDLPKIAEPFFLYLNSEAEFHVAMNADDLAQANPVAQGKKWQ
jgi:hypothetical protein